MKEFARRILASGLLPATADRDAAHIALATACEMDILLSWNCRHIANAALQAGLRRLAEAAEAASGLVSTTNPSIPDHAAVLVIDVQVGLFGATPAPLETEAVIARINDVTAKARQAAAPVIFIQHDGGPDDPDLAPFTKGWKLHPDLQVHPGDVTLRKTTCDAFYGTSLEAELRARGITTLLLMGFATDFCVDSTLRSAASKDFAVIVVADAHTTADNPVLKAEQVRQHHNWAWANCITSKGVTVLPASEVSFPTAAA